MTNLGIKFEWFVIERSMGLDLKKSITEAANVPGGCVLRVRIDDTMFVVSLDGVEVVMGPDRNDWGQLRAIDSGSITVDFLTGKSEVKLNGERIGGDDLDEEKIMAASSLRERIPLLPLIQLTVEGDVFRAEGCDPVQWSIYAEAETPRSARTKIRVDDQCVADVLILARESDLPTEVQTVASALVCSAIRSINAGATAPKKDSR